jgi:large subunit ribosomal protein L4
MELEIFNTKGEKTEKKITLDESIFAVKPSDHAIYLDVRQHLANQRQGTHKAKERFEVNATTKKLKRQKGTGTARAGSMKSPLFRGGGRIFGPRPRDYNFKLNKKVKKLAKTSALTYKAQENTITVVEDFTFDTPRTKNMVDLLNNFRLTGKKTLLVLQGADSNVFLSSRNLKNVKLLNAPDLNTYDILNAKMILFSESAVKELTKLFLNN